jgi:hypothetical protein
MNKGNNRLNVAARLSFVTPIFSSSQESLPVFAASDLVGIWSRFL